MIVEHSSATDKNDLFVRFQNFLSGLTTLGWVIDKTTSNEIYVHNANGEYFAFRFHQLYDNGTLRFEGISCLGATGFDNTRDFWNQPGSSFTNYSISGGQNKEHNILNLYGYTGSSIYEYIFAADVNGIFLNLQPNTGLFIYLYAGSIAKTHNFNGGGIICSAEKINDYSSNRWTPTSMFYNAQKTQRPFTSPIGSYDGSFTVLRIGNLWQRYFQDPGTSAIQFITNMPATSVINIPFSVMPILGLGTSMYSALNALVTPHYFIKNVDSKFVFSGSITGLKILNGQNMSHGQQIFYGDKEYLIAKPSPTAVYFVAIEL
ncbi:MAG: hypothetical protein AB7D29_07775 [Campylobacterales bacterium]